MSRPIRVFTRPRPTTVEITQRTFQFRYLLRPGERLNLLIVGALCHCRKRHSVKLHGFIFLSSHFHLLMTVADPEQMAGFMRDFTQALSAAVQEEHGWKGRVFPQRYRHIELSGEPQVELARMRYLLSNSCKENLVFSPLDWPGVSSAESLVSGEPVLGRRIRRTAWRKALEAGDNVAEESFSDEISLVLDPLPSFRDLSPGDYRRLILSLVREVELETESRHRSEGTRPLGKAAVLSQDPRFEPEVRERTPRRWFHVDSPAMLKELKEALVLLVVAYREAAERLRLGDLEVEFPPFTFPPGLPFSRPKVPI